MHESAGKTACYFKTAGKHDHSLAKIRAMNLAREIRVVASIAMPHSTKLVEHMYLSNAFNVHELPG